LARLVQPVASAKLLFVPGYAWKSNPATGADFAAQRALLRRLGLQTQLIETNEIGSVEDNARIVEQALRQAAADGHAVIVVSASKGGPEAAIALDATARNDPVAMRRIIGWVSVGGMLGGTALADTARQWPLCWLVCAGLHWQGLDGQILHDMGTERRRASTAALKLPPTLTVVHFIGAPRYREVTPAAQSNYLRLAQWGANDGLTLLDDQRRVVGQSIVELGLDHYFSHPKIDEKTLALLVVLAQMKPTETGRSAPQLAAQ
jgi:hypothetical protein